MKVFLSTSPGRGTTRQKRQILQVQEISIHVPRARDDIRRAGFNSEDLDFYPRPPGEGRREIFTPPSLADMHFYPRPPGEGRRLAGFCRAFDHIISIHVPRARDDRLGVKAFLDIEVFLSTSPGRGTTASYCSSMDCSAFLSTSPGRGTTKGNQAIEDSSKFLSTSPGRGTTLSF